MAEKLAPYVVNIPQAVLNSGDQELINWYKYDSLWKQDINVTLSFGEIVNDITNITSTESYETSSSAAEYHALHEAQALVEDLIPVTRAREFRPYIVTTNRAAVDRDFFDIRSNSTVTLDANAGWNDQIITTNGDGSNIKVTSSIELRYAGKRDTTFILNSEGTSIHWYLFTNGTEKFWRGS